MAKNFKKKRLFTVAALTVLLALAMLVFASCETGKTYTLTFETGNGSAVSPIKAKAGDKRRQHYPKPCLRKTGPITLNLPQ